VICVICVFVVWASYESGVCVCALFVLCVCVCL